GNTVQAARTDIAIFHLGHVLHCRDDVVGMTLGLAGVGSMLAGLAGPALKRRWGYARMWLGCTALPGLVLAALGAVPTPALFAAVMVVLGFADTSRGIAAQSLRQEVTPDRLLGRVTAAFWTVINLPIPLGAALTTQLAARAGTQAILLGMGVAS